MIFMAVFIAILTSFLATSLLGIVILPVLKRLKVGQSIKEIGPKWHLSKNGTPTMGGLLFIIGIMSIISNRLSGMLAEKPNSLQKVPLFYVVDILLLAVFPFALHSKIVGLAIMLILTLIVTIINSPVQIHFLNLAESEYPQSLVFASSLSSIFFNFGISLGSATASSLVGIVGLDRISIGSVVFAVLSLGSLFLINRAIKAHSSTKAGD